MPQFSAADWIALVTGMIGAAAGLYAALTKHALDRSVAIINGYGQMVDDMQARIMALTTEIARLEGQMEAMRAERDALAARVRELEFRLAERKRQIDRLLAANA